MKRERPAADEKLVERLRSLCLALPEVVERPSHGECAWFIGGKKTLATLDDHHHGATHLAFWCPSPPGIQAMLVEARPDDFFVPPYVGHRGWIGMRLRRDGAPKRAVNWTEVARCLEDAYRLVAPKKLVAQLKA